MNSSQAVFRYSPDTRLLTAQAVDLMWNEYPGYSDDVFPKSELIPSVLANITLAVRVLRRGLTPSFEELRERRTLGMQRARQSVPLESVIQAYRCTERVILLDLFSDSREWPVNLTSHYADLVISTFDLLSQEIVNSYRETSSAMQSARQLVERDLVLGLASGYPPAPGDLERWTLALEIDPDRPYVAVALQADRPVDQLELQRQRRRVSNALQPAAAESVLIADTGGITFAVFAPRNDTVPLSTTLAPMLEGRGDEPTLSAGLGEVCESLLAAGDSCAQARDALRVARARGTRTSQYRDALPDVLLLRQPELAAQLARTRLGALDGHPHLLETVRSLIRNDLSQSAVARDLFVHLNTVSHRLRRVKDLTGLDPLRLTDLHELSLALSWRALEG